YNVADDEVLSIRQVIEIVAAALGRELEIVSLPYEVALPARPLLSLPLSTHRVLDLGRIREDLGYRDRVPAREALRITARWLVDHPPAPGGDEERALGDPFDYAAEDRLIDEWGRAREALRAIDFARPPTWGTTYSGPGGRPRSSAKFEE
ncbi:MAG: hypothetical protein ACREQJ_08350, partial [Candidatus Binatia bacterium]